MGVWFGGSNFMGIGVLRAFFLFDVVKENRIRWSFSMGFCLDHELDAGGGFDTFFLRDTTVLAVAQ